VERKRSGVGQNSGGIERSGSQKKGRSGARVGAAEQERSGERRSEKSGLAQCAERQYLPLRSDALYGITSSKLQVIE